MEVKSKRIDLSKLDKYIEVQENFGWEVVSKDDLKPNNTIVLTMQRDGESFQDYKGVRNLEKQYHRLSKPFPLLFVIFATLGTGFLMAYFVMKNIVIYYFSFMYAALTFFGMASFALIVYLLLLIKRKKLLALILSQAAIKAGANKDWPTKRNIVPENDATWALSKYANK